MTFSNNPPEASFKEEKERILSVYACREHENKGSLYKWDRPDTQYFQYRLQSVFTGMLSRRPEGNIIEQKILDVGCGSGWWLRTLLNWGAPLRNLFGIDLNQSRVKAASDFAPDIQFLLASGWSLPFKESSLGFVSAHTVFSSVLDPDARSVMAEEMIRVLVSKGIIMIFDFWIRNPKNPDTVGIRKNEIRRLFPGFNIQSSHLILAPPLARKLATVSPLLISTVEWMLPFFRTHVIYLLTEKD